MEFYLSDTGTPRYSLNFKQRPVILDSDLGFELRGDLHVSKIEIADGAIRKRTFIRAYRSTTASNCRIPNVTAAMKHGNRSGARSPVFAIITTN